MSDNGGMAFLSQCLQPLDLMEFVKFSSLIFTYLREVFFACNQCREKVERSR